MLKFFFIFMCCLFFFGIHGLAQETVEKTTILKPPQFEVYKVKHFKVKKIDVKVTAAENSADISAEYSIENLSNEKQEFNLQLLAPGTLRQPQPTRRRALRPKRVDRRTRKMQKLKLNPKEFKKITVPYKLAIPGNKFKSLFINPSLLVDDIVHNEKIGEYKITVTMPRTAKKMVKSSRPYQSKQVVNGQTVYTWNQQNAYVFPLSIKWTTLDVDVDITKSVRLNGMTAQITLKVKNNKNVALPKLVLKDTFFPADVKAIHPYNEFSSYDQDDSEPRLYWIKTISNLLPGRQYVYNYTIEFINPVTSLRGTVGMVDDNIVSVSDDIQLNIRQSERISPPNVGASVVLSGWDFDYKDSDHHINEHSMRILDQSYNADTDHLTWKTKTRYADKNSDDKYKWGVSHSILRIQDGFTHSVCTGWFNSTGGKSTRTSSYTSVLLRGYSNATILLKGWHFDYTQGGDHHIKTVAIRLENIVYNPTAGKITWEAIAKFVDKNGDDDYRWRYCYEIIAFNGGSVIYRSRSGADDGHNDMDSTSYTWNSLKGYADIAVIPNGWGFTYSSGDHHINENSFHIKNVKYNSSSGKISWKAYFNYSDKNFKDDYTWKYNIAIIAFSNGEVRNYDCGPYNDDGGGDSKNYDLSLNSFFEPITWFDGQKNGTETGIDCGGKSPAKCYSCIKTNVNPGNASSANLYSLNNVAVLATANWALLEYAQDKGKDPNTFYSGDEKANRYIEAIAWFVDRHMTWVKDSGNFRGAQSAKKTINESGSRCTTDFCGDCEDHSILRAALLRSLGFSWKCIFSADHHNSEDQGQKTECRSGKKKSGGHTYNIVYYKGRYRIMDYGKMYQRKYSKCWDQHATDNIWNDHYGKHWRKGNKTPFDGKLLMNYPGNPSCPQVNWNWRTYYKDICK